MHKPIDFRCRMQGVVMNKNSM